MLLKVLIDRIRPKYLFTNQQHVKIDSYTTSRQVPSELSEHGTTVHHQLGTK